MKLLFTLDEHDYTDDMPVVERFAVRAIICKNGKYMMQQSRLGDYKIPGGGREKNETLEETLIREVREEVGLVVKPETIAEIGEALELRRDKFDASAKYIAHSYFYMCEVSEEELAPQMTASEIREGYHPSWADIDEIIRVNEACETEYWQTRDTMFLKWWKEHKED